MGVMNGGGWVCICSYLHGDVWCHPYDNHHLAQGCYSLVLKEESSHLVHFAVDLCGQYPDSLTHIHMVCAWSACELSHVCHMQIT